MHFRVVTKLLLFCCLSSCFLAYRIFRNFVSMKEQLSLSRDAEQRYCSIHSNVIGIDEAGRGPLAGPVVTAACFIKNGTFIEGINDSKQTTEEDREHMYEILVNHPDVKWAATVVSHTEIDQVNILQATMNGMKRSAESLLLKISNSKPKVKGSFIALVDGNRVPKDMPIEAQFVIKGDGSIFSIAAASIIAKVTRDRIMVELDKEFPQYNLAQHKGYPTFEHRSLLMKHGPCRIHRVSYAPVKLAMQAHSAKSAEEEAPHVDDLPVATEVITLSRAGRRIRSVLPVVSIPEHVVEAKRKRTKEKQTVGLADVKEPKQTREKSLTGGNVNARGTLILQSDDRESEGSRKKRKVVSTCAVLRKNSRCGAK